MHDVRAQRIEQERAFHNARFSHEVRHAQQKYYSCIEHGSEQYMSRVRALARGADVLEYGCGGKPEGLEIAPISRSMIGIDISDVATADAARMAIARGLSNACYVRMDAEQLAFDDESFDLVFGNGIIHHLDLDRSFAAIARVLRPGGSAVFWEPLGHNPVLNRYRERTPEARTVDEHPLVRSDFDVARRYFDFDVAQLRFYGLTTILSVPLRDTRLGDAVRSVTAQLDQWMFHSPIRWLAWYVLLEFRKPAPESHR